MSGLNVSYFKEPFELLTFENFFNEEQLKDVWSELDYIVSNDAAFTDDQNKVGTAEDPNTGELVAKRKGLFLEQLFANFRQTSKIYTHIKNIILNNRGFVDSHPNSTLVKYIPHTNSDSVLISFYNNGDYYRPHCDTSVMTLIIYLWKASKTFEGGELVFPDTDLLFDPNYNEAILFPSCHRHEVSEIVSEGTKDYPFERISITLFLTIRPALKNDNI